MHEVFYSIVQVLECCLLIKRELGVRILLGIFLSLSLFSRSFLVSVHTKFVCGLYVGMLQFLIRLVKWSSLVNIAVTMHYNGRKLYLIFGLLLSASCPLLALDNGVVTYTDPPVDNAHNSITATHTCFDGYQLVGDSIRICDISGSTGIWRGEHRTCKGK